MSNANRAVHGNERVYEQKLAKIRAISDEQWQRFIQADRVVENPLVTLEPCKWKILFEERNVRKSKII